MTRTVVITGAAGGIGRATARTFSEEGWSVIGADVTEEPVGMDFARYLTVDLSAPADLEEAFASIRDVPIDALVNNAAVQRTGSLDDASPDLWDEVLSVNARSAMLTMSAVRGQLADRRGSVVNIGSVHAVATSPGFAVYAASKSALVGLTRASALELAAEDVRVNAVLPGAIDTDMLLDGVDRNRAAVERIADRTPLRRIGRPEEVAQAVLFLADGSRSSFVTGTMLVVDGGATALLSTVPHSSDGLG